MQRGLQEKSLSLALSGSTVPMRRIVANALVIRAIRLCEKEDEPTVYEALLREAVGFRRPWEMQAFRAGERPSALSSLQREEAKAKRALSSFLPTSRFFQGRKAPRFPLCTCAFFGGMEVRVGGEVVDEKSLSNARPRRCSPFWFCTGAKKFLEASCSTCFGPTHRAKKSVNSFYSLWSLLRRALMDERGACPYLAKHQKSYMVDAHYVKSDVESSSRSAACLPSKRRPGCGWSMRSRA